MLKIGGFSLVSQQDCIPPKKHSRKLNSVLDAMPEN